MACTCTNKNITIISRKTRRLCKEFNEQINGLRTEFNEQINGLRKEFNEQISEQINCLRSEFNSQFTALRFGLNMMNQRFEHLERLIIETLNKNQDQNEKYDSKSKHCPIV